ncbi:glycosyltransferase [Massilia forsythiae]|uniref:Glycosyltransferase n=1 Tax=Massilia forsythiae TaxID=2728020 RepID=A0A7Z2VTU0_9BURK|nr:glycosyltransferase [Massilia forsythiae]QJD98881.1 glycosyltransferase [Massilia forsythiae]
MIGIAIPAHNEESNLDACLVSLLAAARHPLLDGEKVCVQVVLDACDDGSAAVVARHQAAFAAAGMALDMEEVAARQVGVARALGARRLLAQGARWLAFTDADTRVSPRWLVAQLAQGADVVCGSVAVDDWSPHAANAQALRAHFADTYQDRDGHRHIHGANLGVSAEAYQAAGGFEAVACHEDVLLVKALERIGARFAWSAQPRVYTSARTDARARGGFGDTLLAVLAGKAQGQQGQAAAQ